MKAIADICIIPIGADLSLSKYIAEFEKIFKELNLNPNLHAYGTNVEGDIDVIFEAIKKCHKKAHEMGIQRISTNIRIGTRIDKHQTIDDKINSVISKLNK